MSDRIYQLTTATELAADDLLPIWSKADWDTRKITVDTLSAYVVANGGLPDGLQVFSSRVEFEAASPPLTLTKWAVVDGDMLLTYVADGAGTAITSFNGLKGSPNAADPIFLEHWGVATSATKGGATSDYTLQVQAAVAWTKGTLNFTGWVKITDMVTCPNTCSLHVPSGRSMGGFAVRTDFNLSASCVLQLGTTEPGPTMGDFGIWCEQTVNPANRAALIAYPPLVDVGTSRRTQIRSLRLERGLVGLKGVGNCGGLKIGMLESGCYNDNIWIDGPLDFVTVQEVHVWPFGSTNDAGQLAIFNDSATRALYLGACDGWNCDRFNTFHAYVEINGSAGAIIPRTFDQLSLDGDGARLIATAGVVPISNLYCTKSASPSLPSIVVQGAEVYVGQLAGGTSETSDYIRVTSGLLSIGGGRIYSADNANNAVLVTGGVLDISNTKLQWLPGSVRTAPFIQQSGTGIVRVRECFPSHYTNASPVVEIGNLVQGTDIDVSRLVPHTVSFGTFPTVGDDAIVHVSRFGAKGDGVTDDKIAIQAANDYVAANGGGRILFSPRAYLVSGPLARSPKVRWVGQGPTQFLEPTNLAAGATGTVTDYMAMLGTKIVASRTGTWGTRRGVVECINPTAFLWLDSGMENIVIYANEIAETANPCAGLSGGNYSRVIAGWSRLADWPMGPGVGGEKVPFTQAMLDNCAVISTGRIYAGSAASYLGGFLFWGDDRRTVPDGIEVFSNANQCMMSGCFARVPVGYGFMFEDSDDFKIYGSTGSLYFPSVDTIVYGTKSALVSNNYCGRHHVIEGHQGSMTADAALTVGGRAISSSHFLRSAGNSVNVTLGSNKKTVPAQALAGNVIDGATTTLPYPAGTVQADYVASTISLSGSVFIDTTEYTVEKAVTPQVAVTFSASVITITNQTGVTWTAGQMISLDRIYTLWDIPRITIQSTGNSGGLTEEMGGRYGSEPVGVLLNRNAALSLTNAVNTLVPWITAQFENGLEFWTNTAPTKITVPRGVHYMQFGAGATFASSAVGLRELHIIKNGYGMVGMGKQQAEGSAGGTNLQVNTAVVPVKEGDFFEARVYQSSGGALDLTPNESTWFQGIAW